MVWQLNACADPDKNRAAKKSGQIDRAVHQAYIGAVGVLALIGRICPNLRPSPISYLFSRSRMPHVRATDKGSRNECLQQIRSDAGASAYSGTCSRPSRAGL